MKPKILIVEDNLGVQKLFRRWLQDEVILLLASSAEEAKELFETHRGELAAVALDAFLPSKSGATASLLGPILAKEMRDQGYTGPMIATSSDHQGRELLIEKGCDLECDKDSLSAFLLELFDLWLSID